MIPLLGGITITPAVGGLKIDWDAFEEAEQYEVRWKSSGESYNDGDRKYSVPSGQTHSITGLTAGTTYTVQVRALAADDTTVAQGDAMGTPILPTPRITRLEPGTTTPASTLVVSWKGVAGADGYKVQWARANQDLSTASEAAATATATSHTITGLTAGTGYMVRVRATKSNADSAWSSLWSGRPGGIAGLTVTSDGTGALDVKWAAHAGAESHVVHWKSGGEDYHGLLRRSPLLGARAKAYTITGLTYGTEYTVMVRAFSTHEGDSGRLAALAEATATPTLAKPKGVRTSAPDTNPSTSLEVHWNADSKADGYEVQWKKAGEEFSSSADPARHAAVAKTATSYTITGLTSVTEYTIRVRATKTKPAGNSEWSDDGTGTTGAPPVDPAAPRFPDPFTPTLNPATARDGTKASIDVCQALTIDLPAALNPGAAQGEKVEYHIALITEDGLPITDDNLLAVFKMPNPQWRNPANVDIETLRNEPASQWGDLGTIRVLADQGGQHANYLLHVTPRDTVDPVLYGNPVIFTVQIGEETSAGDYGHTLTGPLNCRVGGDLQMRAPAVDNQSALVDDDPTVTFTEADAQNLGAAGSCGAKGAITRRFEIRNIGGKPLRLTGDITVTDDATGAFSITQPTTRVAETLDHVMEFGVTFQAKNDRSFTHTATIHVPTTGIDSRFSFGVSGDGPVASGSLGTDENGVPITNPPSGTSCANAELYSIPVFDAQTATAPVQTVQSANTLSLTVPEATFAEGTDGGVEVEYTHAPAGEETLPTWVKFDAETRLLSGRPKLADAPASFSVVVTAVRSGLTDAEKALYSATYTVPIRVVERSYITPTFTPATAPVQIVRAGETLTITAPEAQVADETNPDQSMVYSAVLADDGTDTQRAWPQWLGFDTTTRGLSGTPPRADAPDTFSVEIRASRAILSETERAEHYGTYTVPLKVKLKPTDCTAQAVTLANGATATGTWTATQDCAVYRFTTGLRGGIDIKASSPQTPVDLYLFQGTVTTGTPFRSTAKYNDMSNGRSGWIRGQDAAHIRVPLSEPPSTLGTFTIVARFSPDDRRIITTPPPAPPFSFTLTLKSPPSESSGIPQQFTGCTVTDLDPGPENRKVAERFRNDCTSLHNLGQRALYWKIKVPDPGVGRTAVVKAKSCNNPWLFLLPGEFPTETDGQGHLHLGGRGAIAEAGNEQTRGNRCTLLETRLTHADGHHWNPEAGDDTDRTFILEAAQMSHGHTSGTVSIEWSVTDECTACAPTLPEIKEQNDFTGLCAEVGTAWTKTLPLATGGNGDPSLFAYRLWKQDQDVEFRDNGFTFDAGTRVLSGTPEEGPVTHKLRYVIHDADGDRRASDRYEKSFDLKVAASCPGGPQMQGQLPPNQPPGWPTSAYTQLDPTATVGEPWTWTAPEAFDPDDADVLTYSLELSKGNALPEWMSFDPATRIASGTPTEAGAINLALSVSDGYEHQLTQSILVTLTVAEGEDVEPTPPTAAAGADVEGKRGGDVTLTGSGTAHEEGSDELSYRWRISGASHDELAETGSFLLDADTETVTYQVPRRKDMTDRTALDNGQWLDLELTVTDGDGDTASDTVRITVQGSTWRAVVMSVADASADESDPTIDFTVSLSQSARDPVSARYIALSDTAVENRDFELTNGVVTFAPGVTEQVVSVKIIDDGIDEGDETLKLKLYDPEPRGTVSLGRAVAVGTISNDDMMPNAWLARFGRAVAENTVEAATQRFETAGDTASHVTVAGRRMTFGENGQAVVEEPVEEDPLHRLWKDERREADGAKALEDGRAITAEELLLGSAFHLSAKGADIAAPRWTAWGNIGTNSFDGTEKENGDSLDIEGEVVTGVLGADWSQGPWLAGLALTISEGEGTANQTTTQGRTNRYDVESTMTALNPYVRFEWSPRVSTWALLGAGRGDLVMSDSASDCGAADAPSPCLEDAGQRWNTDISMMLGAVGGRAELLGQTGPAGLALALKGDAFLVRTQSDAQAAPNKLEAGDARASRMRLGLEASRAWQIGETATLTPALEVGLRHDGGDAETGAGVELGGSLAWTDSGSGVTAKIGGRTLLAHADDGYDEWGLSGAVRIEPGASGRGLSLSITPSWGADASSGTSRLWHAGDMVDLTPSDDGAERAGGRIETELGYGFGAFGGALTATPYVRSAHAPGHRDYHAGWRLTPAQGGNRWTLALEGGRSESGSGDAPEHRVGLTFGSRW